MTLPNQDMRVLITEMGRKAHCAMHELNRLSKQRFSLVLQEMAQALIDRQSDILSANADDLADARQAGLSAALLDRLRLDDKRITAMAEGMIEVARLPNPLGRIIRRWTRPNQLKISKVRVPIGVIAIIYEARPNVTADAAALCFKTGNAVILRSGHEALRSAGAIVDALIAGGKSGGLPANAIQLVRSADRTAVRELVQLEGMVNLVIPRGGEALIRAVNDMARVPVIKHYKGVCHIYVDESADMNMAVEITDNAKCQRPGVCNAAETLLVHEKIAARFLPAAAGRLMQQGVEMRGDKAARAIVPEMLPASESDWYAEYLDLILAVRVVPSVASAIDHINKYGSGHSEAIITQSNPAARLFKRDIDAATVYVNASTRFTDGGEFGMGAEIGISTDKLHARGPMGLEELTTYKYLIDGQGQTRT